MCCRSQFSQALALNARTGKDPVVRMIDVGVELPHNAITVEYITVRSPTAETTLFEHLDFSASCVRLATG